MNILGINLDLDDFMKVGCMWGIFVWENMLLILLEYMFGG